MRQERIRLENISKAIYHTKILNHVEMRLFAGEIVALMGANGAGKTILMEILAGVVCCDEGEIFYEEYPTAIRTPLEARHLRIQYIPSHGGYMDLLTVFENLYFDNDGQFFIRAGKQKQEAKALLEAFGLKLRLNRRYADLSMGKKKLVKVAAAVRTRPKVLLMDEPMAYLNHEERNILSKTLLELKRGGTSILLTTHSIKMAKELADRGVILREGSVAASFEMDQYSEETIFSMVAGDLYRSIGKAEVPAGGKLRLEAKHLSGDGIKEASFCVHEGEILGILGLSGSGRTKIMDLLFGLKKRDSGEIYIDGKEVRIDSPRDAWKHRIAYASNKQGQVGVIDRMSVQENMILPAIKKVSYAGCVSNRLSGYLADYYLKLLLNEAGEEDPEFFTDDLNRSVDELSLGYQQIVKLAQCLGTAPKILLLDHPTLGLDVKMKKKIYQLLRFFSSRGMSIMIVSDEIDEMISLCHRYIVLNNGRITGDGPGESTSLPDR